MNTVRLSEQLGSALSFAPPDDEGLIVRVVRLDNGSRPAQESMGIIPIVVVGHEGLDQGSWRRWIREHAIPAYGTAMSERFVQHGIDFRDLESTRPFGRVLRAPSPGWKSESRSHRYLDQAHHMLTLVEKWPSLYNLIATEMAEEDMTLREFVERMYQLPSPREVGEGRYSTLGDLISRNVAITPSF
jgi:hypothetical protein